jgi:tRNA A37 threonylcarbamoyladenosine synthetase subunit TsaC/SUA5/YrdC
VALRIPNHLVVRELLGFAGEPLAVTSANRTGKAECLDAGAVARAFQGADDLLILDGGRAPGGVASTVVDASGAEPVVKREGPIAASEILRAWRGEA